MATPTASPEVAPLVTILTKEQAVYRDLLAVSSEERQAIIDANLPRLKEALQRKQDILQRLSDLEERRLNWLGRYAAKHGLAPEGLTLASIMETCRPADARLLERLHQRLRAGIDGLVEMNAITKSLLEKIVQSIDVSLRFLLTSDGSGQTYGAQGQLQAAPALTRQLLECQA